MRHTTCPVNELWFVTPCSCTMHCATCPVPCAPCPMHNAPCPVHHAPCTRILCPVQCALCTMSCVLCTMLHSYIAPYPMHHAPLPLHHVALHAAMHHALYTMPCAPCSFLPCPMPHGLSTVQLRHSPHPFCLSRGEWGHSAQIMVYGHGHLVHGIWAW